MRKDIQMKKSFYILMALVLAIGLTAVAQQSPVLAQDSVPMSGDIVALGKMLFFDVNLSVNGTQSCATCHDPGVGFTSPDSLVNAGGAVFPGALEDRFGNRKPPTSAYAGESPDLYYDEALGKWVGGMFWDGRATGWTLHDPLAEQAGGPFLNPLEMGMPNVKQVCLRVAHSEYAGLFEEVWGAGSLDCMKNADAVYVQITGSIAAYEESKEVNPFTSKFDLFWDNAKAAGKDVTKIKCGGGMGGGAMMGCPGGGMDPYRWTVYRNLGLTDVELRGLAAFNDPNRANCASCHPLTPGLDGYPLFTNFAYDNLGVPKNPQNPFYLMPQKWNPDGANWVDYGLGDFLKSTGDAQYEAQMGKFKIPTLRNVDLRPSPDFVKAYGHNGYFKSLDEIVLFYAWRGLTMNGGLGLGGSGLDCGMMGGGGGMGGGDMAMMCDPNLFPQPEVNQNLTPMNHFNMMDQSTIVTFLKTLSDGYFQR
jgi:cytochrome c peroxidase